MANPIDELRNTLLSRASQQQPAKATPPVQATAQSYAPQGPASMMINERVGPVVQPGAGGEPVSSKLPQPDVSQRLQDAISGGYGGGIKGPKTGMTVPMWPPVPMPMGPGEIPIGMPNESARVPPRWQRFETGQQMQDAIRNDYTPNPTLVRLLGNRSLR